MIQLGFDDNYTCNLYTIGVCPDCKTPLVADPHTDPFVNAPNMVIVPMACPKCEFTLIVHLHILPPP